MSGPKHPFESVVRQLREGLENGAIILDCARPEPRETDPGECSFLHALAGIAANSTNAFNSKKSFTWGHPSLNLSEELLKTFVADEAETASMHGFEEGKVEARSYIFRAQTTTGVLFRRTKQLYLSVTLVGNDVMYLAGDVSEIQKFQLAPEIKKAIDDSLAAAKAIIPVLWLEQKQGR